MCVYTCVYICVFAHVCIYIPINETTMADCARNDSKALETGCVTTRCSLYLSFEPLIVYLLIHTRKNLYI